MTPADSLFPGQDLWLRVREVCGGSTTAMYHHFLYELNDEKRDTIRPFLNLTHLLIWALAVPRGEMDGTRWSVDFVTKRVLG